LSACGLFSTCGVAALAILMLAIAAGCADKLPTPVVPTETGTSMAAIDVALGQSFQLGNGRVARVRSENLLVWFERVASDERCPVGDVCISEGDAVLMIAVQKPPNRPGSLELHTDPRLAAEGMYLGYRVKVLRLDPRPIGEQPVPLARYVSTLMVSN
jgi:hypothetical protein